MLTTYRRHNAVCKFDSRTEYRCKCPIWVTGTDKDGHFRRESLKSRDWNRAQELVRKWDVEGDKPKAARKATIEEWKEQFLQDAEKGRHLSEGTLRLYKLLFRQLVAFADSKGIRLVNDLDLTVLTEFRSTWNINPLTATKKLERLRSIFKFAVLRKIATENHAVALSSPKVKQNPTLPFSQQEMDRILKAADSTKVDKRVKAFILTMRFSGLRISDTSVLRVDSLKENRLKLYQAKTGEPVSVLLPKHAADALSGVPHKGRCFFWTGESKLSTVTGFWRSRIAGVFKLPKIENGHPHRFRDTFAVALLESGASLENVSVLLGHTSIRVTQKHYNPWVKSRQDALDKAVKKAIGY
jgi:integrase/recombinase XerD